VRIDIEFCGVCHSDLHQAHNHWGNTVYPLVPGHEIVGRVAATGSQVSKYKVGDKVAVGCMVDACLQCEPCLDGEEQYCLKRCTQTYGDTDRVDGSPNHGGYSTSILVREEFVLRLPEGLDPAAAAPLLCAGITSYSPLNFYKASNGTRLGVIGLGGLGHMAIKFGVAMGAEVTLFTTSPGKIEEAKRLGAHKVVLSSDKQQFGSAMGYFDLIIDTVPVPHSMNEYLMCLRRNGNMVLVGPIGVMDPPIHLAMLMGGRKALSGSAIGGIAETQQMLDFCAEKGITCDIEMINIQDINEAYERMERNDVHYRFVIDMASLAS
jgi:uncharacterized zinc-type alcohol dehydrogenase-like protein